MKLPFFSANPVRGREAPAFSPLDVGSFDESLETRALERQEEQLASAAPAPRERGERVHLVEGGPRDAVSCDALACAPASADVKAPFDAGRAKVATNVIEPRETSSAANDEDLPPKGSIGAILIAAHRMSLEAARCVSMAQRESPAPFGETAVRLGLASAEDIRYALTQQFSMPCLQQGDPALDPEVVAAFRPRHEFAEQLRTLRSQIALRALNAAPCLRSIAIVGAERRVGRSFVTANLATVFAQLGTRTLLIDADLVNPRQHLLFKLSNRIGLSSVLAGRADLNAARPITSLPGFAVLTAGPMPPNPHDLVARPALEQFLRRCEQAFDLILLDTPAWNEGTGARMAATAAGAAVLLVQPDYTSAADAAAISREVANVGTQLIGAVLNRPQ